MPHLSVEITFGLWKFCFVKFNFINLPDSKIPEDTLLQNISYLKVIFYNCMGSLISSPYFDITLDMILLYLTEHELSSFRGLKYDLP